MIEVKQLIWDEWNVRHIAQHSVTPQEVELSLSDKFLVFIKGHSNRIMSLGRAGKRLITTVLEPKDNKTYYIVSARDMAKKERAIYRREKTQKGEDEK